MSDSKATIFVRYVEEGFHAWPEAPDNRAYLRSKHRHLFHIEARCEVDHDDRATEFHDVRDQLETLWGLIAGPQRDLGSQSCEMLARRIGGHLSEWSGGRSWVVSVSEDGEAGAVVRFDKPAAATGATEGLLWPLVRSTIAEVGPGALW